ncbi:MAG: prolipoprotein diacylglyceryl transferase [Rhodobacteraceae bacterium]|nr:prolipoprotein diacylglyceryl transferase [Paracoccaceae bacterium]
MIAAIPFPDIEPELFSIDLGGITLAIRWYALAYIAGFLAAWWWANRSLRCPELWHDNIAPMQAKDTEILLTYAILGVIIGGRLGYVIFYAFPEVLADPLMALRIWQGGMSFHGGFLGVIAAGLLFVRKTGTNPWSVGDCFALGAPIGLFLGRLANFINSELWGRPTDLPWGVIFPNGACAGVIDCPRHPSQLYEAGLEGLMLFVVITWLAYRRGWLKVPGRMVAVFFVGYGVARLFVEFFRQADAQFITSDNPMGYIVNLGVTGLTMGQILSLPMIIAGLVVFFRIRPRVGG